MLKDGVQVLGGSLDEIRQIFGRTKVFLEAPIEPQALKGNWRCWTSGDGKRWSKSYL